MIVESTRWRHAWKCSENISTRADPRVQESTRPERPFWWQAVRADSNTSEPTRPEDVKVCRARRADSNCKESTQSNIRADSKMSEPTRSTMTDNITAIFFSLFKTQILKRLFLKSQRSETSRSSIKEVKAPSKNIQEEREKQERGLCPNLIKYPKRAEEKSKRRHHLQIQIK